MSDNAEQAIEGEVISIAEWESRLNELALETSATQIRLPKTLAGKRVNREEIANAFLVSFEMIGGVPRLASWADSHYSEFVKVFGRLLPKETLTTHDGEITVKHVVPKTGLDV